ncbi:nucleoporin, putative (macronuclear) [Tetrahymena thermophila SB210]|uniref:Nucleoporin, putative n=2 Tax=Tetrahymena thermophila TaxID=5911 RepID=Q22C10_TETTS|nr:nucleoporin, putative [Tetrahymena thermophila SB210]EAR82852.4 nucleoporin, putative [Tetrahymena thermophila SB210]|eukprot:XP_001030515.4 nucleoporin, putative [Tetrahymena thermophila SB210]
MQMYGYQNVYNPYMSNSQQQYGYPQNMNPYNNPQYMTEQQYQNQNQMNYLANGVYNNNMNRSVQQIPNQNIFQSNNQNVMNSNPINPIVASRMNRQTSNPVGGSGNQNNQMNRNMYASYNNANPIFNQNQVNNNNMYYNNSNQTANFGQNTQGYYNNQNINNQSIFNGNNNTQRNFNNQNQSIFNNNNNNTNNNLNIFSNSNNNQNVFNNTNNSQNIFKNNNNNNNQSNFNNNNSSIFNNNNNGNNQNIFSKNNNNNQSIFNNNNNNNNNNIFKSSNNNQNIFSSNNNNNNNSSIFNNTNQSILNNNSSIFNNSNNQSIFNNSMNNNLNVNRSNNQSIFNNNNNNNTIQNVFNQPNSILNQPNQTQSIFGNAPNLLEVINYMPPTSIFDTQNSLLKYTPKIRLANMSPFRTNNQPYYGQGNNLIPQFNNKLVLPPPKRLQVKRVANTFIDQKGDLTQDQKQFLNDRLIRPQSTKSFFSEKKPTGILKNSNMIINLRRNSEDLQQSNSGNAAEQKSIHNLNNSLLNMEDEKKKKQQIKELFPGLYNQNRLWNDLKRQSLNKQEQNVKKKYQFLYEMEQDPNSEFYLPRRKALMEEQMRQRGIQLQQEAQENGNHPFDKDRKHIEEFETEEEVEQERQFYREYLDSHNEGLMDLNILAKCTKKLLDLEKWKEELAKQRKYEKFGFGLFKYEMKREFAFVSVICHVTNISTQKSEEIDQLQKVQFKLTDTIQQIISDHYQKHILKSGLIWHRDYDELIGKNATYIDTDGKIVALTPIEKSLKDFKVTNKGKIIIEIFVSEAPVLKNDKYKCSPSVYEMRHWPIEELQSVNQFIIQNQYGKIEFENPVEITRQDLDKIVIIEQQRAIVYPEHLYSGKCPKVGCKLNQQAVVTLYCIDKKAFEEHRQKTIDYEKLERKLKKQCEKNKCEYVNFDRKKFWFSFRVFDWSC